MFSAPSARLVWWPTVLVGFSLLLVLPGCSRGSFLGDRYNNFRAYYNTYYNAKRAFEQGEDQLTRPDQRIVRERYLSVFTDQQSGPGGRTSQGGPFQEAIDKGADLLRERPDSKWADDALLLIGKAYFYQGNYVGAEGKFRETEGAAEERGQPELADEARFWLGRTLTASERFDEATSVLQEGLDREGLRRFWKSRMQLAIAELFVQQRQWEHAAEALQEAIPEVRDADLAGRAQYLLAQVLEASGAYEAAAEAYDDVRRFRPVYELAYAAQLNRALVLGLDAGQTEEGLALIRRMRSDDKNFQNRAEVELAYARLLAANQAVEEADERFQELLYGEDIPASAFRGATYYRYAEFHRDALNDYTRASAYFDSAATSLRTEPGREELYTRAAFVGVRRSAEVYRSYARIAKELAEADSLLYLGTLDDEAFQDAVAAIEAERLREWQDEQRRLNQRRAEAGFGEVAVAGDREFPSNPDRGGNAQQPGAEVGFLNYRDPSRVQDALVSFQRIWGDRPLAPNWRRRQAIGEALVNEGPDFGATGTGEQQVARGTGPPPLDLTGVPRTALAQAEVRAERAQLRYELGNVLFLSLAQPDSAAFWYNRVVEDDEEEPVAVRALYALAEVRRSQDRTDEANALYHRVLAADPESALADAARERLGMPPRTIEIVTDTETEASEAYEQAYARWQAEAYREAILGLLTVTVEYPETEAAPRALLAAAHTFLEWAQRDSLDIGTDFPADVVPAAFLDLVAPDTTQGEAQSDEEPLDEEVLIDEALLEDGGDLPAPDGAGTESKPVEEDPEPLDIVPDSSAQRPVAPDSLGRVPVLPDSLTQATSTEAAPDSSAVVADSLVQAVPTFGVAALYRLLQAHYPDTPYATQASTLLAALERDPAQDGAEDATDVVRVDPSTVLTDEAQPGASLPAEFVEAAPEGTFALSGDLPLNTAIGGYSWRVAALPSPLAARALLRNYDRRGIRAGVTLESGDQGDLYVILLGQFASTDDAVAARGDLPTTGIGRDIRIVDIYGFDLIDPQDLEPEVAD